MCDMFGGEYEICSNVTFAAINIHNFSVSRRGFFVCVIVINVRSV